MTHRILAASCALALLAPAAALAKGPKAEHPGKGRSKPVAHVLKGTVTSVDAAAETVAVKVAGGNRAARPLVGRELTFAVGTAELEVADVDADGGADLGDVRAGDAVLVQAKLPRRVATDAPLSARELVDLTSPPAEDEG